VTQGRREKRASKLMHHRQRLVAEIAVAWITYTPLASSWHLEGG
jgi:hypothetical protein